MLFSTFHGYISDKQRFSE